jgi:hypothetical protein
VSPTQRVGPRPLDSPELSRSVDTGPRVARGRESATPLSPSSQTLNPTPGSAHCGASFSRLLLGRGGLLYTRYFTLVLCTRYFALGALHSVRLPTLDALHLLLYTQCLTLGALHTVLYIRCFTVCALPSVPYTRCFTTGALQPVLYTQCFTPGDLYSVLQDQHDHRRSPPVGVVVLLGFRSVLYTRCLSRYPAPFVVPLWGSRSRFGFLLESAAREGGALPSVLYTQ